MQDLNSFVEQESSKMSVAPLEAKKDIAFSLEISISTLYLWLKSGNYYIEEIRAGMSGDDSCLIVWKQEKFLT